MSEAAAMADEPAAAPERADAAQPGGEPAGGAGAGRAAAAEARRRKVLARGTDRLKLITGEYARPEERGEGAATELAGHEQEQPALQPAQAQTAELAPAAQAAETGPRGLGGALPPRQQPGDANSARENEALRRRQQRWGQASPLGDLGSLGGLEGLAGLGMGAPPAASTQMSFAQVVPLAVEATHALRVLLSALFAQLCFQLHGAARPSAAFLLPAWAAANALPPVLGLLATLLAVTASTTLLLQRSPARLRRLAEQQPQQGVAKWLGPLAPLAALVPGLRLALARATAAAAVARAFLDCLAVYVVTLVLARSLLAPPAAPAGQPGLP